MNAPASTPQAESERQLAGRQLGRYEVLTQLASGGMAAVYIARAQGVAGFERLVAIKVLHPHLAYEHEFISMFLDEARLAARIRHPNVVPTLDISDSEGDGYFLVMEYIEGDHLGALLSRSAKQGERLPRPFVLRCVFDALQGLGAAHRLTGEDGQPLKLVHRDVSPHNILIGNDGVARLTDFGVAKADVRMASTRAGQFKGKLSYMAPEQASSGMTDQRSDLFSMGIILWESLTGRRLFKGESNAATLNKILNEPIPKPSELWPDLAEMDPIVMKALARDPDERFQSAEEFAEALEQIAGRSGMANQRDVAEVVVELTTEKLQRERERVRTAIEHLGRAQLQGSYMPLPRESTYPSHSYSRASHLTNSSSFSGMLSDGTPIVVQTGGSDSTVLKAVVAVLAALVGAMLIFVIWRAAAPDDPKPEPGIVAQPTAPSSGDTKAADDKKPEKPAKATASPSTDKKSATEKTVDEPTVAEPPNTEATVQTSPATKKPTARRRRASRRRAARTRTAPKPLPPESTSSPEPAAPKPKPAPKPRKPDIDLVNPYRR